MTLLETHLKWAIHMSFDDLSKLGICSMKQLYFNNCKLNLINWITVVDNS